MIQATPPALPLADDSSARINTAKQILPIATNNIADSPLAETTIRPKLSAKRAVRLTSPPISARLQIRANGKGKKESWTVTTTTKPLTKGSKQTSFRVRVSDVGFRVCLVYYDEEGTRRERYLCYLSASEWKLAKRGNLADFAKTVTGKLADRAAKEDSDGEKLKELIRRVQAFL